MTLTAAAPPSSWDGAAGLALTYDFQRCSPTCVDVQNSSSSQYTLQAADVGTHYQVVVVATAGTASATATSSQTGAVAPKSTAAPTLNGVTQDGQVLTTSSPNASWDGATGLTRTFLFTRCDANGANCNTTLQNTNVGTYTLTAADMGSRIRVTVSASKGGSASTPSAPSAATAIIAPFSTGAPATPTVVAPDTLVQDGVTLQASNGSWLDTGSLTFSYQWSQCTSSCSPIAGANSQTYVLKPTDVGTQIQVAVTASAGAGATTVTSSQTVPVQPLNTGPPSITLPTVQGDGQTFTAVTGAWDGATGLTFTYQWKRCTANGGSCSPISLATGSSYTAGAADVGHALRLAVSASKNGSAATTSADSTQTNALAPLSTGVPALSGAPQDTATITADSPASDWDGVSGLTQTYQFSRCDSTGVNCNTVVQTGSSNTYVLKPGDIGSTIRVIASASIATSATVSSLASPATSIITPLLLANGAPAAPTGAAQDGQLLTAGDNGKWADEGSLGFKFQWFQCTSSSNSSCTTSLGAASASNTYTLKPTDVGTRIVVVVTAFVGAGAASSMSAQSLAVAPLNTGASVISTPSPQQDGQVFSASIGAWDGAGGLTIAYQWKRCDSGGNGCAAIGGATGQTYTATAADVGQTLKATTTASKGGSATTGSNDSAATAVIAPRNSVVPPISGNATDGQVLSTPASTNSAWDNTPATLAFSYQWVRCDGSGCELHRHLRCDESHLHADAR